MYIYLSSAFPEIDAGWSDDTYRTARSSYPYRCAGNTNYSCKRSHYACSSVNRTCYRSCRIQRFICADCGCTTGRTNAYCAANNCCNCCNCYSHAETDSDAKTHANTKANAETDSGAKARANTCVLQVFVALLLMMAASVIAPGTNEQAGSNNIVLRPLLK
jgi:hypothetical protein